MNHFSNFPQKNAQLIMNALCDYLIAQNAAHEIARPAIPDPAAFGVPAIAEMISQLTDLGADPTREAFELIRRDYPAVSL